MCNRQYVFIPKPNYREKYSLKAKNFNVKFNATGLTYFSIN